jgi:hypothetical protein
MTARCVRLHSSLFQLFRYRSHSDRCIASRPYSKDRVTDEQGKGMGARRGPGLEPKYKPSSIFAAIKPTAAESLAKPETQYKETTKKQKRQEPKKPLTENEKQV